MDPTAAEGSPKSLSVAAISTKQKRPIAFGSGSASKSIPTTDLKGKSRATDQASEPKTSTSIKPDAAFFSKSKKISKSSVDLHANFSKQKNTAKPSGLTQSPNAKLKTTTKPPAANQANNSNSKAITAKSPTGIPANNAKPKTNSPKTAMGTQSNTRPKNNPVKLPNKLSDPKTISPSVKKPPFNATTSKINPPVAGVKRPVEDELQPIVEDEPPRSPKPFVINDPDVIQIMPVFITGELSRKVNLLQFPVRPNKHPYVNDEQSVNARLKPKSRRLEIDIPINTNRAYYNLERARELALGTNEKKAKTIYDEDDDTDREKLEWQTFQSTIVPARARYMVGYVKNGAFHMTPIQNTYQLRPALKYLDKIDEKQKAARKRTSEEEPLMDDDVDESEPKKSFGRAPRNSKRAKAVQVTAMNVDQDPATLRQNVYSLSEREADEESWMKLNYSIWKTPKSASLYEQIAANRSKYPKLTPKPTQKKAYLKAISPPKPELSTSGPSKEDEEDEDDLYF
ncbi:hypothetical protein G9A89_011802 [Geosiphon pyriformis]|nr:hypothetical protein G9A89_011802 [Geosiphon pyriformis]